MTANDDALELMSEEMIATALEAVRAHLARAEHERAGLDRVMAASREEERLLLRLLALRRGAVADAVGHDTQGETTGPTSEPVDHREHPAVVAVVEELAGAGRPVHISELMRLLRQRQVAIPGAGTQANLITHLRRDARLVRPSRGMYALAAWGLENMPAGLRRRRRKRIRVTATSTGGRTEK